MERDDELEDSDDEIEEALKQTEDNPSGEEFLLMSLYPGSKPVVNTFDGRSINWSKAEPVRNQAIFDQLLVCSA